jgi:hypothetical protein
MANQIEAAELAVAEVLAYIAAIEPSADPLAYERHLRHIAYQIHLGIGLPLRNAQDIITKNRAGV